MKTALKVYRAVSAFFVIGLWLLIVLVCLLATSEQYSAECEYWQEQETSWRAAQ